MASKVAAKRIIVERPPNRTSPTGRTMADWPSFDAGYSCANADARVLTLACAWTTPTPGRSRATPCRTGLFRSDTAVRISLGRSRSAIANGSHTSGPTRPLTPMNPGRVTPTTVTTTLLSRSCLPTMSAAPPKRVCQVP